MTNESKEKVTACVQNFHLPRYREIPDVGLYLKQVTKFISDCLAPLETDCITDTMISNYVKKDLITNPVKKQYSRDQIGYLIFIAVAKNVLSLEQLRQFIELEKGKYEPERAYNYFCDELENLLEFVFGLKATPEEIGESTAEEKIMLRSIIISFSHKIYLEKVLCALKEEPQEEAQAGDE
ncbi:MAG: DUF1836 domain-containing protein [Lachnospiraceae bacterium]|nr:DUF1836 domain-containing protein [Lachnospiraceae bacterium]